jgi:hypothetical protein
MHRVGVPSVDWRTHERVTSGFVAAARCFHGHASHVAGVAFTLDGARLASTGCAKASASASSLVESHRCSAVVQTAHCSSGKS